MIWTIGKATAITTCVGVIVSGMLIDPQASAPQQHESRDQAPSQQQRSSTVDGVYDQVTARAKLAELMRADPEPWRKAIGVAEARGRTLDTSHVYYWEQGKPPEAGAVQTVQDISGDNGRVVVLNYSSTDDLRLFTTVYAQSYRTTEELWYDVEMQPTSDSDVQITFSRYIDFRDRHGHDESVSCMRPRCSGGISEEFSKDMPRLLKAGFQDPCSMHPQCARMRQIAECVAGKWANVWRSMEIGFGGGLFGCAVTARQSLYSYGSCVTGGALTGLGRGIVVEFFDTNSC